MRAHVRTLIVLALSVGMLAWFLRGANLREVWAEIQNGRVGLLVLAVGVTCLTYVFRALRWQYLLHPLGTPPFSAVFKTTVIGFAVSTLLPARAGEVVRPYLLARRAGFSATSAFATIILERVLDLVIDSGPCGVEPTTVIDLTADEPVVVRKGRGSLEAIGVPA